MHIFHILLSKQQGGLEQSYIDYCEALALKQHHITAVLHPNCIFRGSVEPFIDSSINLKPRGFYDISAIWKLRCAIKKQRPDIILAHNGRAITLAKYAAWATGVLVVGVSHSYKTHRSAKADRLLALTNHMRDHFIKAGYLADNISVQANMIRLGDIAKPRPFQTPPVIGIMGRLAGEKGIETFLAALAILKKQNIEFKAKIAGDGPLMGQLQAYADKQNIADDIEWLGWIDDKKAFYNSVDIFALPSLSETFGLVILEAMGNGVPVVASDLPGPASIISHKQNGQIVAAGEAEALAKALAEYITKPDFANKMAQAGTKCVQKYSLPSGAEKLDKILAILTEQQ